MRFTLVLLACSLAFAQPSTERSIPNGVSPATINAIKTIVQMRDAVVDLPKRTVTLTGTTGQIELADWLMTLVSDPARDPSGVYSKLAADGSEVRVLFLKGSPSDRDFAELATVIRSALELRSMMSVPEAKCILVRGTRDEVEGAQWLVAKLDQPSRPSSGPAEEVVYILPPSRDPENLVCVLYLKPTSTEPDVQSLTVSIRTTHGIARGFLFLPSRAIVVRGTRNQLRSAASMVEEFNRGKV